MLSAHGAEVIAYVGDGYIICRDCAIKRTSTLTIDKVDAGLSNGSGGLSPLIRYTIQTENGERIWEEAEERVREFERRHPTWLGVLADVTDEKRGMLRWRLVDRVAERMPEDVYGEHCEDCGEFID